jgi:hypothetical protein
VGGNIVSTKGDVSMFAWAPDSSRLAYLGDIGPIDQVYELLTALPTTPGTEIRVMGAFPFDTNNVILGDVYSFKWTSDSARLIYIADQFTDEVQEVFSTFPTTAVGNALVSGNYVQNSNVVSLVVR